MDSSGHVVLGDPADKAKKAAKAAKPAKPAKAPRAARSSDEPIVDLSGMLEGVPKPVLIGGLALAVLVILYALGFRLPSIGGPAVPAELIARSGYVGDAFSMEQSGRIRALAVPGTEAALDKWYQTVRPLFKYTGPKAQGNTVIMTGSVEKEDLGAGTSLVLVTLTPPQMEVTKKQDKPGYWPGYRADGTFRIPLHWARNADGVWQLDGAKMEESLQEMPSATDEAKAAS